MHKRCYISKTLKIPNIAEARRDNAQWNSCARRGGPAIQQSKYKCCCSLIHDNSGCPRKILVQIKQLSNTCNVV